MPHFAVYKQALTIDAPKLTTINDKIATKVIDLYQHKKKLELRRAEHCKTIRSTMPMTCYYATFCSV
jgi:hypothetical protein